MPSRTPYESWEQRQQRKRRQEREIIYGLISVAIIAFWIAVIYGVSAVV